MIRQLVREALENQIAIVDLSQLRDKDDFGTELNLSAEYQIAKKQGKKPYEMVNHQLVPLKKGFKLKDAIYVKPEDAAELNTIGLEVVQVIDRFEQKRKEINAFTAAERFKDFDRFRTE